MGIIIVIMIREISCQEIVKCVLEFIQSPVNLRLACEHLVLIEQLIWVNRSVSGLSVTTVRFDIFKHLHIFHFTFTYSLKQAE